MNTIERARAWLASVPGAVSGQNGHSQTFTAATGLIHGFELSQSDALTLLQEWNQKCSPKWSESELNHKIRQAISTPHSNPKGYLKNSRGSGNPVSMTGKFVVRKLLEIPNSESRFSTEEFLRTCFDADDTVCICNEIITDDEGRSRPASKGTYLKRDEWIKSHFTAPISSMWTGKEAKGAYVRINPCSDQSGMDTGVAVFRHVLVEMDEKSKVEQWTILKESNLPFSVIIDSGGKSLHGWVRVDASTKEEWEQRRNIVYQHLDHLGIDPKNKNASRFSRLPGVMRDGVEQKLIAINQGAPTWEEFIDHLESANLPSKFDLNDIITYDKDNDPDNLIGDRWLRRGTSLLFVGQSGCGKSSLIMSQAIHWAHGIAWFGIQPIRPLKIMVIQAENDIADMHDSLIGAAKGVFSEYWESKIRESGIEFYRETVRTGIDFTSMLRKMVKKSKPDVVYIDPLLSYIGGNPADIEICSQFTRQQLQPLMIETGVIIVLVHHFPKPKGKDEKPDSVAEMAYSGFGSSDLTNWAREVMVLREAGYNTPRRFVLGLAKRSMRSGLRDRDGNKTGAINIQHSTKSICWEYAPPEQFVVDREVRSKGKGNFGKSARR